MSAYWLTFKRIGRRIFCLCPPCSDEGHDLTVFVPVHVVAGIEVRAPNFKVKWGPAQQRRIHRRQLDELVQQDPEIKPFIALKANKIGHAFFDKILDSRA